MPNDIRIYMTNFEQKWNVQQKPGVSEKLRGSLKQEGPLKPRVHEGVNKLQIQISKLDGMLNKIRERDARLFQRIVAAMKKHDNQSSRILSNELAELRKVSKTVAAARMALEQVQLRLTTIHDLGDAMVAIGPAMQTMKGLKGSLGQFMPEADAELNGMTQTLNGLMMDSLAGETFSADSEISNGETEDILREASSVAEQQLGDQFPSVPAAGNSQSTSTL